MLDKFADELRAKREQSGITLQQMANKTRIDLKFLEAIDEGNFAFLPDLYVKAFVKQYAVVVGLDASDTIKRYEAAKQGKLFDQEESISETENPLQSKSANSSQLKTHTSRETKPLKSYNDPSVEKRLVEIDQAGKDKLLTVAAFAGIFIVLIAVYLFFIRDTKEIIVAERPFEDVIEESQQRYIEEESDESDNTAILPSDSLYLKFTSTESAWIFVVIDESRTEEFTLAPNVEHTVVAGNNFKATIGNSGGVKLILNNKPVEFSGRSGSVRHFSLDRQGLQYLNTPPKLNR
jgi:cytoskeletal protein RodZ